MNFAQCVEFLKSYPTRDLNRTCPYCAAINYERTVDILMALSRCMNCIVDIASKGQWSGYGIPALRKAFLINPDNPNWPLIFAKFKLMDGSPANEFAVGDLVTWKSQAQGSTVTKSGKVVAIVPPGTDPHKAIPPDLQDKVRQFDASGTRKETSYIVAVPTPKGKSCHLYWPRVKNLRKISNQ